VKVKKSGFERTVSIVVIAILVLSSYVVIYWYQYQRFPMVGEASNTKVFYIKALMWEYYPREIRVQEGDHVILYLSTADTIHGFYLEAWNKTVSALYPNMTARVEFTADKVGRFEYYCTYYCGIGHYNMKGYIVVEPRKK